MTQPDKTSLPPDAIPSDATNKTDTENEIEPIAPDDAREAIENKIQAEMPDWKARGWMKIYDSNYLVRLHKDRTNLDFQCDLLGSVEIIEREANPVQLGGRLVAWMVLLGSLTVALALAVLAGFIG